MRLSRLPMAPRSSWYIGIVRYCGNGPWLAGLWLSNSVYCLGSSRRLAPWRNCHAQEIDHGRSVVNGQKVWTSRGQHRDLLIPLARPSPLAEGQKKSDGLSCFIVKLAQAVS